MRLLLRCVDEKREKRVLNLRVGVLEPVLIIDITEIYGIIQMLMTENERTWYYAGFISLHIRERR